LVIHTISEPGQSPDPHTNKTIVGIDLGTTNSLVATLKKDKLNNETKFLVIPDEHGQIILPSIVNYNKNGFSSAGKSVEELVLSDPKNTILSFKRLMGRSDNDIDKNDPYFSKFNLSESNQKDIVFFSTDAGEISPIQASADILKALIDRARKFLNTDIFGAVITVPAYFDDAQRQATKDAARIAGINLLRLINEPTAAALAYGLDKADDRKVVIYDLGGGTFDVSILQLSNGVFEVLSTGGDPILGGDDFDSSIVNFLLEKNGIESNEIDIEQYRELLIKAKNAKEKLTKVDEVTINFQILDSEYFTSFSRFDFEGIIRPLVERTLEVCGDTLKTANCSIEEISDVVLVGGSTKSLFVKSQVEGFFKKKPMSGVDPDSVVAIGAAIQADNLIGNTLADKILLLDVTPLSLGVEMVGGLVEKIIERNTMIPVSRSQQFTTHKDGQTALSLHILQGERDLAVDCRSLANFELRNIPPMTAGAARIEVTFEIDSDGLLNVSAEELSTGVSASIDVKPSYGLDENEIIKMLHASHDFAAEDLKARSLAEATVEARSLLNIVENAISADSHLLNKEELDNLESIISALKISLESGVLDDIKNSISKLNKGTEFFAEKRMSYSIKMALSGKALDDIESSL
jgi:molecular chaperone HscA